MNLNAYIWNLYKESKDGQQTIADYSRDLGSFCQEFGSDAYEMPIPDQDKARTESDTITISVVQAVYDAYSQYTVGSTDEAIQKYAEMVANGIPSIAFEHQKSSLRFGAHEWEWYENVDLVSWGLYFACSEFFLPYLFVPWYGDGMTFYALEEICTRFNIALPSLPPKRDQLGKALYYGQLMRAFYEFRQLHNLSPAEMCAFLYDFGLNVIEQRESEELPEPSKVWLIKGGKGGKGDLEFVDQATNSTVAYRWGGNLEIRSGDILLMYLLSPRSHIHSIWRALSDGFADPFFHYHDAVAIGSMVKTKPVTFQEMKSDPILGQKGLIRANLQGASGDPFSVEEYDAILSIMERKGQDISLLPRLEPLNYPDSAEINNERDVEKFLIEPFLERLGYTEDDWIRQMSIKMGRGERNYPDYAFGATTKRGEESASMVLEAKYRIGTRKELRDAFYQAKSYALRLQAKRIVLCALDGVWIFEYRRNDFNLEDFVHKTWNELSHPDTLHEVSLVIGRKEVLESR
jgi:hypothetical protein